MSATENNQYDRMKSAINKASHPHNTTCICPLSVCTIVKAVSFVLRVEIKPAKDDSVDSTDPERESENQTENQSD